MTPRPLTVPARLAGARVLSSESDQRLVDLVRAGSEPAFEVIVARYNRQLLRYCSRFLPEARAEDVVQETFIRAHPALLAGNAEMHLRPWLHRIAHNAALNALRDRALQHHQLDEAIDGVQRPDQALERHERLRETVTAVRALPERQCSALVMREFEGRSYEEISGALRATDGAVRQLLNRARARLSAAR